MLPALIQPLFANAGTPLMWGTALHLFAGNAVIGILEGLLLIHLFKARAKTSVLTMIAANYLSAWLGRSLIPAAADFASMDINTVHLWFWTMAAGTWAATLVSEWPFVLACTGNLRRSIPASFAVQTISYILLFGFYWVISATSLLHGVTIVPPGGIPLPASMEVYFIGKEDGNVYRLHSSNGNAEIIHELQSKNQWDRLFWQKTENGRGILGALLNDKTFDVQKNVPGYSRQDETVKNAWFNFGKVEPVPETVTGKWDFCTRFWAGEGLKGTPKKEAAAAGAKELHVAIETPFVSWIVRNAVLLPGDKVLFQFGTDQICIFDAKTSHLALLCRGRGPVAVLVPRL